MKKIDILLLARPDHSLQIYNELSKQQDIKYHFVTFRVFKRWLRFLNIPRVGYVDRNVSVLVWLTVRHILKYNFGKFTNLNEKKYFEKGVSKILKSFKPRVIHFWPSYCYDEIKKYKKENPNVVTIADQYMPNPVFVLDIMKPVYDSYGLQISNTYLECYSNNIMKHFDGADYIAVPSRFVEDTMKLSFPNHKYIRQSYGIKISPDYSFELKTDTIRNFIYVGGISLEKGVDSILEYFSKHTKLELHLFGGMNAYQREIFDGYKQFPNIHFHGAVSKDVLNEQFKMMDVGIHPSRFDAYSLAVGEEIGSGLPVIVSDNTGICDDVLENVWGLVFKTGNLNSLDAAIKKICINENYNKYKTNIDTYITSSNNSSYGEAVLLTYQNLLNK